MNVLRASDSATTDIGFVSNVLDTSSLNGFCSGTTCTVNIWYDQCGGGYNLVPGTAAPVIYTAGAVTTINGKPAVSFTAASTQYLKNTSLSPNPVNTLYQNAVLAANSFSAEWSIAGGHASGLVWAIDHPAGTLDIINPGVTGIANSTNALTAATGAVAEVQYNSTTGAYAFWINRASGGMGSSAQTIGSDYFQLGDYGNAALPFDGFIGEYISYDLVGGIPSGSQTSIENNQKTYWGTP